MTSARQAGTGGLALEDPWRHGRILEATTVLLDPGLRWLGFAYQGGLGSTLRIGVEVFHFSTPSVTKTLENPDGTFGGESGTTSAQELGARALGQVQVLNTGRWRLGAIGRMSGLMQTLDEQGNSGFAMEAGLQAQRRMAGGRAFTAWGLVGPLGRGAQRGFAGSYTLGAGLLGAVPRGLFGKAEGYGLGVEGDVLSEGLFHGGLGALYWFGQPSKEGTTMYFRTGVRLASESAQDIQPRGGVGVLWRSATRWGVQFDYAFVPLGELGAYHYGTVGLRLPPPKPKPEPIPAPRPEPQPVPAPTPCQGPSEIDPLRS